MSKPPRENPFPGLDPWMQQKWHDVHTRLIAHITEELCDDLPDDLVARAEESISDDDTARWVEIRTVDDDILVTAIEVLSPANKTLEGRAVFDQKVRDYLHGEANVVEIDLVRGGRGRKFKTCQTQSGGQEVNNIFVMSPRDPNFAKVYGCPFRKNVPAVQVPLRPGEASVILDLQPLIDRCYARGRYWTIDHTQPASPTLDKEDKKWAGKIWEECQA